MKNFLIIWICCLPVSAVTRAQTPISAIIKTVVKKVVNAMDLEVQKLQNRTIELQNVQKALENTMSKLQLDGITNWVEKIRDLYSEYYQELSQVKAVIADYDQVKAVIAMQSRMVAAYQSAYRLFKQDKNFSPAELSYMYQVYTGILEESLKNLNQVLMVVDAWQTQMTDESRLKIISNAYAGMQKNYNDLKQFNSQNIRLSLQRAVENNDLETVKQLYGLK